MRRVTLRVLLWAVSAITLLPWILAACAGTTSPEPNTVLPSPTAGTFDSPILPATSTPPLSPEAGSGGARGLLASYPPAWANQEVTVWFSPFYQGEQADEGIFVLDPAFHPSGKVEADGRFELDNIPEGRYVIVFGPAAQDALAIREENRPKIFEILEGQILDVGEVRLEW